MREDNEEQPMHPIYNYAYITDAEEGLILTNVDTLQDGEPRNNFLTRALTWNEGDILKGARYLTIAGTHFYVSCRCGRGRARHGRPAPSQGDGGDPDRGRARARWCSSAISSSPMRRASMSSTSPIR